MKKIPLLLCFILLYHLNLTAQETYPMIVKFNYSCLEFEGINDQTITDLSLADVLNERGKRGLENLSKSYPTLGDLEIHKLFPFLTTKDTISISRTGEKVTIPPFWATFQVIVPLKLDYLQLLTDLNQETQWIDYAHPEFEVEFASVPDDTLYYRQYSLNGVLPDAHINIEEAWDIETGVPWIKVGVHDTGIDTLHPDITALFGASYNGVYSDPATAWGAPLDESNNGHSVAGIIGAE